MTTASTAKSPAFRDNRFAQRICIALALAILISAYKPDKIFDWWLENATAMCFMALLVVTYRKLPLSDMSYLLILIYLIGHEFGAHYKYSDVPLGEWMKPWLHTQRNHYDRVMHFSFGFLLSYPMQEFFMRKVGIRNRWRYMVPVEAVLSFSAIYEMLEALAASVLSPERGEEFVGMQGDMWDSQEDMFVAGLGAITAMILLAAIRHYRKRPS